MIRILKSYEILVWRIREGNLIVNISLGPEKGVKLGGDELGGGELWVDFFREVCYSAWDRSICDKQGEDDKLGGE